MRNLLASLVAFGVIFGTVGCESAKKAPEPAKKEEAKKEEAKAPEAPAPAAEEKK